MDYKIYKINNGYKVGRKDKEKINSSRIYLTKKPLTRDGAKRFLLKLQLEERGIKIKNNTKKFNKHLDGYIRIDPLKTKKRIVYINENE